MASLFSRHSLALHTLFAEVKRRAVELASVPTGSPGSVGIREVKGRKFYYRQFYDARGRKAADYVGPVDDPRAEARARSLREAIAEATGLAGEVRTLVQQGFVRADPRTSAILGAFANHHLFRGGAILVPELQAHATALPFLGYLLNAPIEGVVLGRESVVPVRIPRRGALSKARAAAKAVLRQLETAGHERAADAMRELL